MLLQVGYLPGVDVLPLRPDRDNVFHLLPRQRKPARQFFGRVVYLYEIFEPRKWRS